MAMDYNRLHIFRNHELAMMREVQEAGSWEMLYLEEGQLINIEGIENNRIIFNRIENNHCFVTPVSSLTQDGC